MTQGDKVGPARADEGEEIDRIMKEIEDLEKKMDTDAPTAPIAATQASLASPILASAQEPPPSLEAAFASSEPTNSPIPPVTRLSEEPAFEPAPAKVVLMRSHATQSTQTQIQDSIAETDAVPARDEPLVKSSEDSGLSLKIAGCTDVNLEFSRAGISVTLSCSEDGLSISTNQGAEFRIPFKRIA